MTSKLHDLDTLLSRFIEKRIASYVAPQRKGTPKGDRIGFPLSKHMAAVLSITYLSQKEIAERSGVSYSLLLKWRTENDFRTAMAANARDFANELIEYMRHVKPRMDAKGIGFRPGPKGAMHIIPRASRKFLDSLVEIADSNLYGTVIYTHLIDAYLSSADSVSPLSFGRDVVLLEILLREHFDRGAILKSYFKKALERILNLRSGMLLDEQTRPRQLSEIDHFEIYSLLSQMWEYLNDEA